MAASRVAVAAGIVLILAAVVGPAILTGPKASPGPSDTTAAVQPSLAHPAETNPAASAPTPTIDPTLEPWPDLVVPNYEPAAQLLPTDLDRAGLAARSSFTLRSLTATPAVELARGLQIDPPTAFAVKAGPSADIATIRPLEALTVGLRYRFRLEAPDGALAGTWAFITKAPLHVVGTLPADQGVEVPKDTGIEVTFDQDGPTGFAEHFRIVPAVTGRFEAHERTWAFVPDQPLANGTIYTVTVTRGVSIAGSSEILEHDVTLRFETAIAGKEIPRIGFGRAILEVRPNVAPVVAIGTDSYDEEGGGQKPSAIGVTIHRLPTFAAVVAAATTLAGPEGWAIASPSASVSTKGLTKVADVDAELVSSDAGDLLRIPVKLAAGSYIATIDQPGAPAQLLLQVTNLSAYALTATKTTVVWVNDLANDASIAGAKVSTASGVPLGTTGADGLISTTTPAELTSVVNPDSEIERAAFLLEVVAPDGRRLVVPIGLPVSWTYREGSWYGGGENDWWLLLRTDRSAYRQTDTVHVYGTIRTRADRAVPDGIEIRLRPADGPAEAPILRVPVTATERGVFTADLHLDDLPMAAYSADLFVGRELVSSTWIAVTEIRKPAYRIEVNTDRHVYLTGDAVRVTARATFYDGTAVPEMELRFGFEESNATASATTNAQGEAQVTLPAPGPESPEGWSTPSVSVRPVRPEEGQIGGGSSVIVFPSRAWLHADGSITGDRLVLTGTLTWADLAGFERASAAGKQPYDLGDAAGRPIAGGSVRATVTHLIPVRTKTGTTYDFIEKKVVPIYEYDIKEVDLRTSTLTAAANGSFRLSMTVPVPGDGYRVTLSTVDPEGRRFLHVVYAAQISDDQSQRLPYLAPANPSDAAGGYCGGPEVVRTGLDDPITVTLHEGNGDIAADGKYLFLVGRRGTVDTTLMDASSFTRVMRDADLPDFTVRVVRLSGDGYVVADAEVIIDPADKRIAIKLKPNKTTYRPGDPVRIDVTTTNASGQPISADVVIQGVDEKLYTLGLAEDFDPLDSLLSLTGSGFLQSYRTHAIPLPNDGGCGGEGGGGDRTDFRDTVTFQRITTDSSGHGSVAFELSGDLTSWHMSATAVSASLDAGRAAVLIPVSLPFFVDAVLAPEYLVGDLAVLRLRAYGGALAAGDHVQFTVEAPSIGVPSTTVDGVAFDALRFSLPAMPAGDHPIRIRAVVTHGTAALRDSLVRTVRVVQSRLGSLAASYDLLQPGFVPLGGDGLTTYVITDAGRGRLISLLEELASRTSARFDRSVAAELARNLLIEEYDVPAANLAPTGYVGDRYQRDGIALLPYGSTDLFLSAKAALVARSKVDVDQLRSAFEQWLDDEDSQRERQIVALAGLAAIGDDVLGRLREIDRSPLTIREQLWLGLAFVAAGDESSARTIERGVLESSGQRLGPWVRLAVGKTLDDSLEASGLLLLLAARLGDPLAHDVSRFLVDHPSREQVFPLEQVGYVQGMLDWLPRMPGRFAWTVSGERHEVALDPGGSYALVLTKGQRTGLSLEPLDGELAVATTWTATNAALPSDPSVSVTRTVTPIGNAPDDRLVRVTFRVTFGPSVTGGCYRLTDLLPSGLAPLAAGRDWDSEPDGGLVEYPYEIDGQRVSWCVYTSNQSHTYGYAARVVSPGTYRWEPAVIQSETAPSIGSSTPETIFTIR